MTSIVDSMTTGQLLYCIFTISVLASFGVYGLIEWVRRGTVGRSWTDEVVRRRR